MNVPKPKRAQRLAAAALVAFAAVPMLGIQPAAAQAAPSAPVVSAFGATVAVGGQAVVPPTPTASVATRGVPDDTNTVVNLPAAPVAVNGTITASAAAHLKADITSGLSVEQTLPGPYHARGLAQIEGLELLFNGEVPILSAAAVRSEAVAVCGATPAFAANSEVLDLRVGGTLLPLNAPVQQIVDGITGLLDQTGLDAVVNVQRNVVTNLPGGGIGVDALVVTVLAAVGEPLVEVRLAHSEVTAAACKPVPQCSDTADNDGDAKIDKDDPGCHTDGNAGNASSFDPNDNDESDLAVAQELPRTGGTTGAAPAAGLLVLAAAAVAARRKLLA